MIETTTTTIERRENHFAPVMTHKQVAQILGISVWAVKDRERRALRKIKTVLGEDPRGK